jgi:uncharacterized damage-inducible protein DinB
MTHYDVAPLEGFHPEIGVLLAALQDSTREWKDNLGEVSLEALRWQPEPGAYSIAGLLMHLIDCEAGWFFSYCAGQERPPEEMEMLLSTATKQMEGEWPEPPHHLLEWYFETLERIRARGFEALKGLEPDKVYVEEAWDFSCTLRWVVAHVVQHDSYTGGQAVALHELWKRRQAAS